MNDGQSNPSPVIRFTTNEWYLGALRHAGLIGLAVVSFFLNRLITQNDEGMHRMEDFRRDIQAQVSAFRIDYASNTSTVNATIIAIQDRQSAQSRRLDSTDGEVRDLRNKFYEGRTR